MSSGFFRKHRSLSERLEISFVKKSAVVFLKTIIVLVGLSVAAFMLWEPHLEGRNAQSTLFEIYFKDPFLAYAYIASIPFFMVLYQAFKLLRIIEQHKVLTEPAISCLRIFKNCAMALIGFALIGEVIIFLADSDDRAGGVFVGLLVIVLSILIALVATKLSEGWTSAN